MVSPAIRRLRVRFPSGTQKVFLREQLESVRIKNIITKLPQSHHSLSASRGNPETTRVSFTFSSLPGRSQIWPQLVTTLLLPEDSLLRYSRIRSGPIHPRWLQTKTLVIPWSGFRIKSLSEISTSVSSALKWPKTQCKYRTVVTSSVSCASKTCWSKSLSSN